MGEYSIFAYVCELIIQLSRSSGPLTITINHSRCRGRIIENETTCSNATAFGLPVGSADPGVQARLDPTQLSVAKGNFSSFPAAIKHRNELRS